MRLLLKILSLPLLVVTGILYVFCKFLVLVNCNNKLHIQN